MISHSHELDKTGRTWFRGALNSQELQELRGICNLGTKPGLRISHQHALFGKLCKLRFLEPAQKALATSHSNTHTLLRQIRFNELEFALASGPRYRGEGAC